jgi:hypothetical protein
MKSTISTFILLSLILVAWTPTSESQVYDYERKLILSRTQRDGKDTDDYREISEAEVTESAYFQNGIHLESRTKEAIAVAVYAMEVEAKASSLAIRVGYRGSGRIFVRDATSSESTGVGATFELPTDKERVTFHLAAQQYINAEAVVEIHAVVADQQALDIELIEVEGLRSQPRTRIVERYRDLPEPWHGSPYWYYYTGPVYTLSHPYHYVLYDDWWYGDWYTGWRASAYLHYRYYPIRYYSYSWWPTRRAYHYHYHHQYHTSPKRVYVDRLPESRRGVHYKETRRRASATRSRLAGAVPQLKTRRTERLETSRTQQQTRPSSTSQPRTSIKRRRDLSDTPAPSRIKTVQPRSSTSSTIKRRRSSSYSVPSRSTQSPQRSYTNSVTKQRRSSYRTQSAPTQRRSAISPQRSQYKARQNTSSRSQSYRSTPSRTSPSRVSRSSTTNRIKQRSSSSSTQRSSSRSSSGSTKRKRSR